MEAINRIEDQIKKAKAKLHEIEKDCKKEEENNAAAFLRFKGKKVSYGQSI